jgi:hypothetical protein
MPYTESGQYLVPIGKLTWTVKMAFRELGTWSMKLRATDAGGTTELTGPTITVVPSDNPGYIRVSPADNRYFEFDNGEPALLMGHNHLYSTYENYTTDGQPDDSPVTDWELWQRDGINFTRIWLSRSPPLLDPWSCWKPVTHMYNYSYLPPIMYTYTEKYDNGDFSWYMGAPAQSGVQSPGLWRGYTDITGKTFVEPNTTYRICARVKARNIVPTTSDGGLLIKVGGWTEGSFIDPAFGTPISDPVTGSTEWINTVGYYTSGPGESIFPNLFVVLQEVSSGDAYMDQLVIQKVNTDGTLSDNITHKWNANAHYYLDPVRCIHFDHLFEKAVDARIYYKAVIFEKHDYFMNHIDNGGLPSDYRGNFDHVAVGPPPGTKMHRIYEYYWRHLIARWGYATSIHSWELVNEGAPPSYFNMMNDMADYFHTRGPYPRMVTTSFWHTWVPDYWADSRADYGNIHAYALSTGWINSIEIDGDYYDRNMLNEDAAALVYAYSTTLGDDPGRTKPVMHGETDFGPHQTGPVPEMANDVWGIWLHNFNWGHINHGGTIAMFWFLENLHANNLHHQYRTYMAFMKDIPLNSGGYRNISSEASNPGIRCWGQMQDNGNAVHIWIQNKGHTWKNVVDNGEPAPVSGTVTLHGLTPGPMTLETWDTWDTSRTTPIRTEAVNVDANGNLQVTVDNLIRDAAFKAYNENRIKITPVKKPVTAASPVPELKSALPNPFSAHINFHFQLPQKERVILNVHNSRGEFLRTLSDDYYPSGHHDVRWDGLDSNGKRVPAGMYILLMKTETSLYKKKIIAAR